MQFSDIKMSKNFNLLDFMNANTLYTSGIPITAQDVDERALATGRAFCEDVLEPLYAKHGPMSFSSGFIPSSLLKRWTPHSWKPEDGAAADVIVHSWVNQNRAPIMLVKDMIEDGIDFERLITYAGSEVICMSGGRRTNRKAVYENKRIPGAIKPEFRVVAKANADTRTASTIVDRPDWRRLNGEASYHHRGELRAQHVRVGHYFTLLDFCRDQEAMALGKNWVPPIDHAKLLYAATSVAKVLDPMIPLLGRVSVTSGLRRKDMATSSDETWTNDKATIKFWAPNQVKLASFNSDLCAFKPIYKHKDGFDYELEVYLK